MLSRCMAGAWREPADVRVLEFYNISGTHFHGTARRTIVIKVPREDDECNSGYAVLDSAMYGAKDAAQRFDVACEDAMTAMGFLTGVLPPCLYHSTESGVSVFRHGDDFVVLGTRQQQKEFQEQRIKHFGVKRFASLGPCGALGDVKEVRMLNRIVRWVKPLHGAGRER